MTEAHLHDGLPFRNGFLARLGERDLAGPPGWRECHVGELSLWAHPDARLDVIEGPAGRAVALGEAFEPGGELDPPRLFRSLHETFATEGRARFLDALDRVAGRFALLVEVEGSWEVYHDAMGSRSLFYHRERSILASHVELIAEPLSLRYAEFFIPFLTSHNYFRRDVKYLPGLATPYAEIRQLTPNTTLAMPAMRVRRYWPRAPIEIHGDVERAAGQLVDEMLGLRAYLERQGLRPILGLTGGTDSRGLFAALRAMDPFAFTFVRSRSGEDRSSPDARVARTVARACGAQVETWGIRSPAGLNDADNPLGRAFRRSTALYRGIDCGWLHPLAAKGFEREAHVFVRGFGGEIMRGFYHDTSTRIARCSAPQLARAYDVNAGSNVTRSLFEEFMQVTEFEPERLMGYDLNDVFYWEHRMGTWGSIAMTEADLAARALVGYNSRRLYESFLGLRWEQRKSREAHLRMIAELAPELAGLETV